MTVKQLKEQALCRSVHYIREAMETHRRERLRPRHDLYSLRPSSFGQVLKPLSEEDDLLSEMLGTERRRAAPGDDRLARP